MFNQHLSLPLAFVANQVSALSTNGQRIFDDVATIQNAQASMNRALKQEDMGLLGPGYGCWCYFEDQYQRGKGDPVDAIDALCKDLHAGYECILRDFDNPTRPELSCIPWEVDYNSAYAGGYHPLGKEPGHIEDECNRINTVGTCQNAVCRVEGYFMQGYFFEQFFNFGFDAQFNHATFDPQANCFSTVHQLGPYVDDCCGSYPHRMPFRNRDDNKCCGNNTYNPGMFFCCDDGTISTSELNCS